MFENMLNAHDDPVYKQITVEFFVVLCKIMKRHPEFSFIDTINVDTMINQAIKLYSEVSKVNSVQEASAKCFLVHILKFKILKKQNEEHQIDLMMKNRKLRV